MILVIGGAFQGKLKQVLHWMEEAEADSCLYADGRYDSFEDAEAKPVIYGVQAYLARCKTEQVDSEQWLEKIIQAQPQYIIMDEVGYGVVPVTAELREYRELAGHAGQRLAAEADAVYRVVCGVSTRIK